MADLIDRQALYEKTAEVEASALHMVEKLLHSEDLDEIKECAMWSLLLSVSKEFKHDLEDVPSAEPERKTGRWKLGPFDRIRGYWATCSACERTSFGGGKYCPNCGALMEGVDDEKE